MKKKIDGTTREVLKKTWKNTDIVGEKWGVGGRGAGADGVTSCQWVRTDHVLSALSSVYFFFNLFFNPLILFPRLWQETNRSMKSLRIPLQEKRRFCSSLK